MRPTLILKIAAIVWLLLAPTLVPAITPAGDYDDLISSADSDDLTPQERAHFIDARDRFPKLWLSNEFNPNSIIRWLDNTHLVFSTRSYPGWVAQQDEDPRVISVNIDTDKFVDLGYRGELECLNHKGDLMIRLRRARIYNDSENDHWFIGTVGKKLQKIEWKSGQFIPNYVCRQFPFGDPIYTTPIAKLPPDAHRILPLLPGHGYLKETVIFGFGGVKHPVSLIKPDGTAIAYSFPMPLKINFEYQPWSGRYFERKPTTDTSFSIDPSGDLVLYPPPKLLRFWHLSINAGGAGIGTKKGILWEMQARSGKWRKQGLYLESTEGLLRIEDGSAAPITVISPNGCRIFAAIQKGNLLSPIFAKRGGMIIDLCNDGENK